MNLIDDNLIQDRSLFKDSLLVVFLFESDDRNKKNHIL
jgi:hypothetical protein